MREIKFRGIRIDSGEWAYGFWGNRPDGANFICPFENYESYAVIPESVGQLTGLRDSKGVDIYEHDIFKGEDDDDSNGLVIWHKDGWYIQWSKTYKEQFSDYHIEGFEVIGNLYQHPELLTP